MTSQPLDKRVCSHVSECIQCGTAKEIWLDATKKGVAIELCVRYCTRTQARKVERYLILFYKQKKKQKLTNRISELKMLYGVPIPKKPNGLRIRKRIKGVWEQGRKYYEYWDL
jgi:hypothetical protein